MSNDLGARQFVWFSIVVLLVASSALGQAPTPTPNGPPILTFRPVDADGCPFCCSFSCQTTPTPTPHLDPQGRPIFTRNESGFILVLEGSSAVGTEGTYQVNATSGARNFVPISHSSGRPSVQLLLQKGIGNESTTICDIAPPTAGGVPGFDPPDFNLGENPSNPALKTAVTNALKDMACRFDSVTSTIACTRNRFGDFAFLAAGTVRQFCYAIPSVASFKDGDTIVAAQFRGTNGNLGPRKEIVIRVGASTPTFTPTPTPTPLMRRIAGRVRYYSADRPVSSVTAQMSGPSQTNILTDSNGAYDFTSPAAGSWVVTPKKAGPVLSGISSLDAAFVLQRTVGLRTFNAYESMAGDVTGNGVVSSLDAARILQRTVGLLARFDVANTCDSDWAFFPMPGAAQNQTMSNPVMTAGNCQMGRITLNPLVGAALSQDFYGVAFGDVNGNWMPPAAASSASTRPSSAIVRLGRTQTRRTRRVTVPVSVQSSAPFSALDLEVGYDPNRFRAIRARAVGEGRKGLLQSNTGAPGLIRVSMASGEPMVGGTAPLIELEFEVLRRGRGEVALRSWSAAIDDRPVQTVQE